MNLDLAALLGFGILALAFVAWEIAGLTVPGFHTISYLSRADGGYPPLRVLILILFALLTVWWWVHSGRSIPR